MTRVIDTGSCGCHIAHEAFKDGAVVSGRGIHRWLDNAPVTEQALEV